MSFILGISAFYHDSAAALVKDGKIIAAAQEERFSRIKGDSSFPLNAITYCLEEARIDVSELSGIAYYDKPLQTFERLVQAYTYSAPKSFRSFLTAGQEWSRSKLFIENIIKQSLQYYGPVYYTPHHLSHAAAAYYPSAFESAAILTIDGVGEWATASIARAQGKVIEIIKEMHFPDSLGLLYSAFTYYCGFKINSGEYKLMGLAPYGQPVYLDLIKDKIASLDEDGGVKLNMEYFTYLHDMKMFGPKFEDVFGGPRRQPEAWLTRKEMDIAASIQKFTEEAMVRMARAARRLTGEDNLCLAGGVALNCVGNGKILQEKIFKNIFVQPAAGDAGSALGAALAVSYNIFDIERTKTEALDHMQGSYLGPRYSRDEVRTYLESRHIPYRELKEDEAGEVIAKALADKKVAGFFNGRMEFGPRSLGARSILGDPRQPETQKVLNLQIKFRESFRPFAPSVLAEDAKEYFDLEGDSPYMLMVAPVKKNRRKARAHETPQDDDLLKAVSEPRSDIPAVTHWDYSARVQTVHKETNPLFHEVLAAFKKITGFAVLVNTSFNVTGEPIVCTPHDAYRCFMRTHMDYLYLEGFWIDKKDQPAMSFEEEEFAPD